MKIILVAIVSFVLIYVCFSGDSNIDTIRKKEVDLAYDTGRVNGYIDGFNAGFTVGRNTIHPKPDLESFRREKTDITPLN